MALPRQSLSPTASLLRNSRLFALPNPLPRPPVSESLGAGVTKASDSATLPYPTHQAIATTKASLARGDWGLKRPLPSRSYLVKVSDPVLRITQLDTIEHVTDFDSAADHVRTRQKWEEMGAPMMKGMSQLKESDLSGTPPAGAFEVRDDTTSYNRKMGLDEAGLFLKALKRKVKFVSRAERKALEALQRERNEALKRLRQARLEVGNARSEATKARAPAGEGVPEIAPDIAQRFADAKKAFTELRDAPEPFTPFVPPSVDAVVHNTKRWKHEGPWLPGMGADDFVTYLAKEVSERKDEFNKYMVEFVKNEIYTTRRLAASKDGRTAPMDIQEAEIWHERQEAQWRLITKPEILAGVRALRKETANDPLGSRLVTKLILPFLRLPAVKFKSRTYAVDASGRDVDQYHIQQESAPLSTHPSAGLGYLRTKAYIANHPILGPQTNPAPVPARVIQPRSTSTIKESYARFGVAGFVANDQFRSTDVSSASRAHISNAQDVETIDINTTGGKKVLVHPMFGSVTNDGRIHIKLKRALGPELQVARGELDDKPPVREDYDSDPLSDLGSIGKSGVKELDEQSAKAKQLGSFLDSMRAQGSGQPPSAFPGTADPL